MSEELLPCPFCGSAGKMFKAEWLTPDMRYTTYQFGCENENCPCSANRFSTACTEEKAIEAWNTRAERTCRRMPADDGAVVVRRGGFEMEFPYFECSECGAYVMDNARYCPNCGAKVVE